ncbi:MAG: glycosyltransferase [Cyanobacteria bacterium J06598_1]
MQEQNLNQNRGLGNLSQFQRRESALPALLEQMDAPTSGAKTIAIYLDALQGYGADKVVLKIANGLVSRGLQVELVLSKVPQSGFANINPAIRLVSLEGSRHTPIKNVTALASYLKRRRPDILFSSIHFNNVVAALALTLSGVKHCKLILRQANALQEQFKDYFPPVVTLLQPLTRLAYRRADVVVSPCRAIEADLTGFMKVSEHKIQVIYNPTVTKDIAQRASDTIDHKWLHPDRTYPVIVSVGRLKPQKDFFTLLRAFKKFQTRYEPDAKLVIVGEGPLRHQLESLAKQLNIFESTHFLGFHQNPYAFMAAADVYVSSSRYEGLPNTVIEAVSLGQRIVATACQGGTAEILRYGQYGKLVPVKNPDVMATGLAAALAGEPIADPAAAAAAFEHEAQVEKYYGLFIKVANDVRFQPSYEDEPQSQRV